MRDYSMEKMVGVTNTGPLISAFQCGRLDLIKHFFSHLYISRIQVDEFVRHAAACALNTLISENFVQVLDLSEEEHQRAIAVSEKIAESPLTKQKEPAHHLPEAEAIILASRPELRVHEILLDELAAREIARELKLRVSGFAGVLAKAGLEGLLTADEIRRLLTICRNKGTRYSIAFIEEVANRYGR